MQQGAWAITKGKICNAFQICIKITQGKVLIFEQFELNSLISGQLV